MKALVADQPPVLAFTAETAADLMSPCPGYISPRTTLREGAALLAEKNVAVIPVVDENARLTGVLSRSDLVAHDAHHADGRSSTQVRDVMTPVFFSVAPHTPVKTVAELLLSASVDQLFVTDKEGRVLGVVSLTEVLRELPDPQWAPEDNADSFCECP